jgi:DsbC/DsbD-like thiol-disulfide interchange protein
MRSVFVSAVLLAALVLAFAPAEAAAQGKKSDSVVKVSAKATKPDSDGKQVVTITLDIDKPWHVYANPVNNDMLKSVQTAVKFTSKVDGDVKFDYPAGKVVNDKTVGDYKTYEGKVEIKATVRRAKDETGPLKLTVKIQACDNEKCLLPATVKLTAE